MKTAILALLLFCIMIFPHELGHFIAAKRVGVKVNEFAFGMGPALWKKQGKENPHISFLDNSRRKDFFSFKAEMGKTLVGLK